ncbi:MAG: hypothetical protein K6F58_07990 [Bacteroidales bacterium]|nr:hypothetical protein [Bacteroidales bacterium]
MRRTTAILALALALAACSGPRREVPELLRTVPSRSVEVMHFRHAGKALKLLLDSTSVFRQIDLGHLESAEMVLSYDYSSRLVPLLALDAGRYRTDTSETVKSILSQAEALKIQAAYVTDTARRSVALLLTPSTAAVSEALIHIAAGTSVLDAKGFPEALALSKGGEGSIILRNSAAGHLLPRDFLADAGFSRRDLVRFVSGASEWTVLDFDSSRAEDIGVEFSHPASASYYLSVFQSVKGGESRLGKILPASADWVVDLPLADWSAFYEARRLWMDANSILKRHDWICTEMETEYGKSPRDWFRSIRPKEVASVHWEGRGVTAIRCGKTPARKEAAPDSYPGYAGQMFGSPFSEPEGSVCSTLGKWLIIGLPEDVSAFLEAERIGAKPEKHIKYSISRPGMQLVCTDRGTSLTYSK